MRVETESHLELINGFGRNSGSEDLVQTFEGVMVALKAADTGLDGQTGFHRVLHRANSSQGGQILVGFVSAHSGGNLNPKSEIRNSKEPRSSNIQGSRSGCELPR